jgi:hypothetical protein
VSRASKRTEAIAKQVEATRAKKNARMETIKRLEAHEKAITEKYEVLCMFHWFLWTLGCIKEDTTKGYRELHHAYEMKRRDSIKDGRVQEGRIERGKRIRAKHTKRRP